MNVEPLRSEISDKFGAVSAGQPHFDYRTTTRSWEIENLPVVDELSLATRKTEAYFICVPRLIKLRSEI